MKDKTQNKMSLSGPFSLLGFLSLLGLLGFFTHNIGFFGFFGFLGFFGFSRILPDEMFKLNVNKAAKNAFMAGLIIFPIVVALGQFIPSQSIYNIGFALNFAIQVLVFTISLYWYEKKGDA